MANKNKKTQQLVTSEDDPTAELEMLALKLSAPDDSANASEATADTDGVEDSPSLEEQSATINRLQYDIAQFRARWNGLEAEISARQQITENLQGEITGLEKRLERKNRLLKKRAASIKSLKAEIRERNANFAAIQERVAELEAIPDPPPASQRGQLAAADAQIRDMQDLLDRTEVYADQLRRRVQEQQDALAGLTRQNEVLESDLDRSGARCSELETALAEAQTLSCDLETALAEIRGIHEEEIRIIRFELGQAQETVSEQGLVAEQLASDLLDTRNYRAELELMLSRAEESSRSTVEQLEAENRDLREQLQERDRKLETRSDAISSLLAELAGKSRQIESIVEIRGVDDDPVDTGNRRAKDRPAPDRDRITRLLVGTLEGQELRFPLFKDRLTIGRTEQNDIQLQASYVSRRHAVVVTDRETTRVIDWGSKNGVFVNGNRITEHFLKNGDTVTIGTADFRYEELPRRDS